VGSANGDSNLGLGIMVTQDVIAIVGVILSAAGIALAFWGWTLRAWLTQRRLIAEFGADLYLPEDIKNATHYYVRPDATSIDLAQEMEESTNVIATREDLFKAIERFIEETSTHRHMLLLADSGMGKTSFALNYYDYNRRKWRKKYRLAVIPLGYEKAFIKISEIKEPKKTILFLDAFDEDPEARKNYEQRLNELMKACSEFRRVLITCRTQFFPKDDAIPRGARMIFAPRSGQAQYTFWRLYLAPFNDKQVKIFLRKRFWLWSFVKRRKAYELVKKVPRLTVRPMLLANIPDLLEAEKLVAADLQVATPVKTTWSIYETLIEKWYEREEGFWKRKEDLKTFSEEVAVQFYLSFLQNGSDRVPKDKIEKIVQDLRSSVQDLDEWKATTRSLLHRDAKGDWKFAHRSIMEFLFLKNFFAGDNRCRSIVWTGQMKKFVLERTHSKGKPLFLSLGSLIGIDLSGVDLNGIDLSGKDLYASIFKNTDLSRANLESSNLSNVDFSGANLSNANLSFANLRNADFSGAILRNTNLVGADISNIVINGTDLRGLNLAAIDLSKANLSGADISGIDLSNADFSGANLRKTILNKADLSGTNFSNADMSEAMLNKADLISANLHGVNLSNADLREADFGGADLSGADLSGADLCRANLGGADLSSADLSYANFKEAELSEATLNQVKLTEANLYRAYLDGTDLRGVDLREVKNITVSQILRAKVDEETKLPLDLTKILQSDIEKSSTLDHVNNTQVKFQESSNQGNDEKQAGQP
jgi:uncharacterized protein YjbI with pentapeptide repeats